MAWYWILAIIGVAAFFVGTAFARSRDKLSLARPYLRRLLEMTGETANLFVESFPAALHFLLQTTHSPKPVEPHADLIHIPDFRVPGL